jgi:hypothetical protein
LEQLPVEVFRGISDYLTFFDVMSLAQASKKCHWLLGPLKCPDRLSWIIYLYVLMNRHQALKRPLLGPPSMWYHLRTLLPGCELHKFYERSRLLFGLQSIEIELHKFDARMHRYCEQTSNPKLRWIWQDFQQLNIAGLPLDNNVVDEPLLDDYFKYTKMLCSSRDQIPYETAHDTLPSLTLAYCELNLLRGLCAEKQEYV